MQRISVFKNIRDLMNTFICSAHIICKLLLSNLLIIRSEYHTFKKVSKLVCFYNYIHDVKYTRIDTKLFQLLRNYLESFLKFLYDYKTEIIAN